jgi:hypothetical protein
MSQEDSSHAIVKMVQAKLAYWAFIPATIARDGAKNWSSLLSDGSVNIAAPR